MTKEVMAVIIALIGFAGNAVRLHFANEKDKKAISEQIEKSGDKVTKDVLSKLQESDDRQTITLETHGARLDKMESTNNKVKTIMELRVFEKNFIREFKKNGKQLVQKLAVDEKLKDFLTNGVAEMASVFKTILEAQFLLSNEEIEGEFEEAQLSLSSKFKHKSPEFAKYKSIVRSEVISFIEYYNDVKVLENGERMEEFKKLCKKTTISIIKNIV